MGEDFFKEGEQPPEGPPLWRPPMRCPQCHQADTRLVTMRHEMSVYTCERCHIEFEIEEAE